MYTEIKTFEDACTKQGISTDLPQVTLLPVDLQKVVVSNYKLLIIAKAINEGWTPNWNDGSLKYYPWFRMRDGFSFDDYVCDYSLTYVSSRLCFQTSEKAEYFGRQFLELHKDVKVID